MKNVFGKEEDLKLYNDKGDLVYKFHKFYKDSFGNWCERTYDDKGNPLTFTHSNGVWCEWTYDENGNLLTFKNSKDEWREKTYDDKGNILTYKNFDGDWAEYTYDDNGNELTFKNSNGISRGLDIPEYTMEELTKIVGKEFKIKK